MSRVLVSRTTVVKHGNSMSVAIPKIVLENVGLARYDIVEIYVENGEIIITPSKKEAVANG